MKSKFPYRIWQFWQSFKGSPENGKTEGITMLLDDRQLGLFQGMKAPDQNHSMRVYQSLRNSGVENKDLLQAALLHDAGKQQVTLYRWERIFAVLLDAVAPRISAVWGEGKPTGLRKPLAVYHQHAAWGAELAREAGCSSLTVWLICNHETDHPEDPPSAEALQLLKQLQFADNSN
jgi:hypothetical protein